MSRKWNPFSRKKIGKADSHGTTLANEEIQFQPGPRIESQWGGGSRYRDSLATEDAPKASRKTSTGKNPGIASNVAGQQAKIILDTISKVSVADSAQKPVEGSEQLNKSGHHHYLMPMKTVTDANRMSGFDPNAVVPSASILRTSPRVAKKLIKPGTTNGQQSTFVVPTPSSNAGVTISDEYTEPFDAVNANQSKGDGYIEPYEATQLFQDVTQGSRDHLSQDAGSKKNMYDDPWDKTGQSGNRSDYEEPWDNNQTLPYAVKPMPSMLPSQKGKSIGDLVLEYPNVSGSRSGGSSTSSSSASLVKQRMIKLASPRQSPRSSPSGSPRLDRRLIRPKDVDMPAANIDPRLQYHAFAAANAKPKPVDRRLIKAEPAIGEVKRRTPNFSKAGSSKNSSKTSSPVGSSHVSPNRSPMSTLSASEAINQLSIDPLRRSSSPLVSSMNMTHHPHLVKSRSLDVRNQQFIPNLRGRGGREILKSASDDQLILSNAASGKGSQSLVGVTEYEEPWDGGDAFYESKPPDANRMVAHSRSKSYELGNLPQIHVTHGKSYSFDKPEHVGRYNTEYDQPWNRQENVPRNHLKSMQRFQHRQLELHPSEAICPRDFNPLAPLEKQSWFHGSITRDEAIRRLDSEVEGSYLVRNSESIRNNYSLSLRTQVETIHMVISKTRDGYWILGEFSAPFHSIPEMIAFYAAHRLKINDLQQISLRYPVSDEYL